MKICEYVPHGAVPDVRGFAPAIVAQNFAKFLKNDDVYIVSNQEGYDLDFEKSEYGDVYRIAEGKLYEKFFKKITRLDPYPLQDRAAKIVNNNPIDIFHAHQLEFDVNRFRKKTMKSAKVAVHVHAMRKLSNKNGLADRYIACSEYTKRRLIDEKGYPEELVSVVYNGADIELFSPATPDGKKNIRKQFSLPVDCIVVSYIGRKQEAKGYGRFLNAAKRLVEIRDDVFFICVGPTPADAIKDTNHKEFIELENRLALSGRLISRGALSHIKLSDVYKVTDIVYFPTSFGGEQHPVVGVEAIASGCILIATKFAGLSETIEDNVSGFFVEYPPREDEGFEKLHSAIKALGSLDSMRDKARDTAVNKFTWDISAKNLHDIFHSF